MSWYPVLANFMYCYQLLFYEMNGGIILEHVLLLPGTHSQEKSVYLTTAPGPVVNIYPHFYL